MSPTLTSRLVIAVVGLWYAAFLVLGPDLAINHDETNFLYESLRLPAEGRLAGYTHGSLMYELIATLEVAWYFVLRLFGQIASPQEFLSHVVTHEHWHLVAIRAVTAVAAVLMLLQLFRVASLFGGPVAGALSVLLCATNYTFIAMTSMCKEDVLSWLFALSAMDFAWRIRDGAGYRAAILAGLSISAATAAKYFGLTTALLVLVPLVAQRQPISKRFALSGAMAAAAGAGFIVLFPFILTDRAMVFTSVSDMTSVLADMADRRAFSAYILQHVPNLLGAVVITCAIAEALRAALRDPAGPILLALVPLSQLVVLGSRSGYSMAHYIFPVALVAFVLASTFVGRVAGIRDLPRWARIAMLASLPLAALLDGRYLPSSIKHAAVLLGPDTRHLVAKRVEEWVPAESCVVVNLGVVGENVFGPPLRRSGNDAAASTRLGAAQVVRDADAPGPNYRLIVIDGDGEIPDDICDWIVAGYRGSSSGTELGHYGKSFPARVPNPPGFMVREEVLGFPDQHSIFFPYPTTLDYEELRRIPLREFLPRARLGVSFRVYERARP